MHEVPAVSNTLALVSSRQSWGVTGDHTENIVEASLVIHVLATEFSLPILQPSRLVFIVSDSWPEVEVKEPEVEEPSRKRAWSSRTTQLVSLLLQSISDRDRLLIKHDFVGCVGVNVEFSDTQEKSRGYLQAKLEKACQG